MIDRRKFAGGLALTTLAWSRMVRAQPVRKPYRIGILNTLGVTADVLGPAPRNRIVAALLRGLRDQGYVYGQHFVTEGRAGASRPERFPVLALSWSASS